MSRRTGRHGQTMIEYGLAIMSIAIAVILVLTSLGWALGDMFSGITSTIGSTVDVPIAGGNPTPGPTQATDGPIVNPPDPINPPSGTQTTLSGSGFCPYSSIQALYDGSPIGDPVSADDSGSVVVVVTIPENAAPGSTHYLALSGQLGSCGSETTPPGQPIYIPQMAPCSSSDLALNTMDQSPIAITFDTIDEPDWAGTFCLSAGQNLSVVIVTPDGEQTSHIAWSRFIHDPQGAGLETDTWDVWGDGPGGSGGWQSWFAQHTTAYDPVFGGPFTGWGWYCETARGSYDYSGLCSDRSDITVNPPALTSGYHYGAYAYRGNLTKAGAYTVSIPNQRANAGSSIHFLVWVYIS